MQKVIKIGLLGAGTVGSGVIKVLEMNRQQITERVGAELMIKKVLVRDCSKVRPFLANYQVTDKIEDILNDDEIEIVVELMGGLNPAKDYMLRAMEAGKNVVTANKDVVAQFGKEMFAKAEEKDVDFLCTHDLVVTGLWGHAEGILGKVRKRGVPVAFDGAERPFDPAGQIALPHTDIAFFSDDTLEDEALREKILGVAAMGPKLVVATRGSRGSLAWDGVQFYTGGIVSCPVVDTMGAGDSFIAGFLMAWLEGKPVPSCMQRGAEQAAFTIGYAGGW